MVHSAPRGVWNVLQALVRSLPHSVRLLCGRVQGVTEANFRTLMAAADSLAGLVALPEADMAVAMGSVAAARKLREWLDATCPVQR